MIWTSYVYSSSKWRSTDLYFQRSPAIRVGHGHMHLTFETSVSGQSQHSRETRSTY
jgi:hypothetical protein